MKPATLTHSRGAELNVLMLYEEVKHSARGDLDHQVTLYYSAEGSQNILFPCIYSFYCGKEASLLNRLRESLRYICIIIVGKM